MAKLAEHPKVAVDPGPRRVTGRVAVRLLPRVPRRCLHLFAGPARAHDLAECLRELGWTCLDVDTVREGEDDMDLLCDATWQRLRSRILAGEFGFVFAGTPCSTYSSAREHPGGPPPLRSAAHIEGLPHLRGAQKEEQGKCNLLRRAAVAPRLAVTKERKQKLRIHRPLLWPAPQLRPASPFWRQRHRFASLLPPSRI